MNAPSTYNPSATRQDPDLSQADKKLHNLLMQAPAAIALLEGPQHIFLFANRHYQETFGRSAAQLIGKSLREAFPEFAGKGVYELFDQVYQSGKPYSALEFPASLHDYEGAQQGYYNFIIQPLLDDAGQVYNLMVHAYEVTEQVLARKRTEESEVRYRSIFQHAGVSMWEEDFTAVKKEIDLLKAQGITDFRNYCLEHPAFVEKCMSLVRVTDVNDASLEMFEAEERDQLLGNPTSIFLPEAIPVFIGQLVALATGKTLFQSECRLRTIKGKLLYVMFTLKLPAAGEPFDRVLLTMLDISHRREVEEKIKASEAKFRSLIQHAPAAIGLFVGRDLVIQDPNQAFVDIVGKGWGITGKPLREAMPELITENQPYLQILDDVFTTGKTFSTDGSLVKIVQQGVMTYRYYNFTYSPLFDEEGNVWAILDIAIDVTEQVRAREAIAESEARFRNILEQTPEPMLVLKGENLVLEVANEPLFRTWNMDESVLGKPLLECLPELRGQGIVEMMLDVYHNKKIIKGYDRPVVYDRGNGVMETLYYNFVYSPYVEANGDVTGVMIIGTDVTGSVLARQALEESENRFRTLATTIPQIVWTADEKGQLDYLSNQWETYTGQSVEDGLLHNHQMIHPEDLEKLAEGWRTAVETGMEWRMDYRIRNGASGNYRWFTGVTSPLKDSEGRIVKWIGTATDIHEQKMFTEELEGLVAERTRELQRSNEDLQQFAHVVSHDLKEPVRKAKTFTGLLEHHLANSLDETARRYIDRINSATSRMYTMIDGVLRYSMLNAASDDFEPVDLTLIIQNIETDLEVMISEKQARIHYGKLPTVEGAPILLYQVFYNLIYNSIKFARAGIPPQMLITSEIVDEGKGPYVRLVLEDNGIGFKEEQATAIFESFTRLHPKDKYDGTGLGLSLCKKIIERHKGSIKAQGVPDEGARFTILLPASKETP